jgi:hypothetical protein
MQNPDENIPIVSAPRSSLDPARPPEPGELRTLARALIELALQLKDDDAQEERR